MYRYLSIVVLNVPLYVDNQNEYLTERIVAGIVLHSSIVSKESGEFQVSGRPALRWTPWCRPAGWHCPVHTRLCLLAPTVKALRLDVF